jgi:hypothetical protein
MSRLSTLVFTLLLLIAGCSGPSFRAGVYRGDGIAFRLGELPSSFERLDAGDTLLAFRDDAAGSTVLVNGRCGSDSDVPLSALTGHLFMTFTERQVALQQIVPMDGREAMHTVMRAKLDGVPKAFDVFVLKKDGCVYDFVNISIPSRFETNRAPFERFIFGFHTLSDGA